MIQDISLNKCALLACFLLLGCVQVACVSSPEVFVNKSVSSDIILANKIAKENPDAKYISVYYVGGARYACVIREVGLDSVRIIFRKYQREDGGFVLHKDEQLADVSISKIKDVKKLWESIAEYGFLSDLDAGLEGDGGSIHFIVPSGRMAGGYLVTDLYGMDSGLKFGNLYNLDVITEINTLWNYTANAEVMARELAWRTADMTLIRRAIIEQKDQ